MALVKPSNTTCRIACAITVSLTMAACAGAAGKGKSPTSRPTARVAADGTAFPPIMADRLNITLPTVGRIGCAPERLGCRVYSTKSIEAVGILSRLNLSDTHHSWVAPGLAGGTGFLRLDNGCVTAIWVYCKGDRQERRVQALAERIHKIPTQGSVPIKATALRGRGMTWPRQADGWHILKVELDPVEWYVHANTPSAGIIAAMREHRLVRGMTLEEASLATRHWGEPKLIHSEAGSKIYLWRYSRIHWKRATFADGRLVSFTQMGVAD